MYVAANAVPIAQAWSGQATFPAQGVWSQGFRRLDVFANGTDAVVQFLEADDPAAGGWQDDQTREVLCPMGFHSIPVESVPFVAVRFKVWSGTLLPATGTVHMRAFT